MRKLDHFSITKQKASDLLSFGFGETITVEKLTPLSGGVGAVFRADFDKDPGRAILKLSKETDNTGYDTQIKTLRFYKENTDFPVQAPYFAVTDGKHFPFSALCLEFLRGNHLGTYPMTVAQASELDVEMAQILARLHSHTHSTYKHVFEDKEYGRWVDVFRPGYEGTLAACKGKLDEKTWKICRLVLDRMEDIFDSRRGPGRLIHGDIWACNIIIKPNSKGGYCVSGFIDGGASYSDVESELAYLLVFRTVGPSFFEEYIKHHPIDEGFSVRRLVYNLHTLMMHVHVFGDAHYHTGARQYAEKLAGYL